MAGIDDLRQLGGFVYLASPYSLYRLGQKAAFNDACRAAGALIRMGLNVFCPIAHSHAIGEAAYLDHLDYGLWGRVDRPFVDAASGMIVLKMEGWDLSVGVADEINLFTQAGKPIAYVTMEEIGC